MAILPNIPCLMKCRIIGKFLVDHAINYALTTTTDVLVVYIQQLWETVRQVLNANETIRFMVDKEEITYIVDMFGEEESDGTDFVDMVLLSDEDSDDRLEPRSHKENPKKNDEDNDDDDDEKKYDKMDDDDEDNDDHALIRTRGIKEKVDEALKDIVPKLSTTATNDLINDNLPRIVANVIKKERESLKAINNNLNVHPTISTSTVATFDLQQQLYLKRKSDLQAQVIDPELWDVLKAKFEKFSASAGSCRNDAFRKLHHDAYQGDDAPPEGKVEDDSEECFSDYRNVEVVRVTTEQKYNDTEDMYYLCLKTKINCDNKLLNSLLIFTRTCDPFSIIDKPTIGLMYFNNKNEKRFMDLEELSKFCDATLEKVLKEVKMKIFEAEFLKKDLLLGNLDLKIMKAYKREIDKRLKHRK
ncbi:hypothetical protein Tco_0449647 [Tanacetum coccineum]